jgi:SpoVK/Ycf46/Vps4 family AAA+-type ATPase
VLILLLGTGDAEPRFGGRSVAEWARALEDSKEDALDGHGCGGTVRLGPPDDPRTLTAAKRIARDLGRPLYRVDLGKTTDESIGETEKNLSRLLEQAKAADGVLFFDEGDALLGKRSKVGDSHDRYANQETSHLLSRIEAYGGIAILASNLRDAD